MKQKFSIQFLGVISLVWFLSGPTNGFGKTIDRMLNGAAYGNGAFVVVGADRTIMVSQDGTHWRNRSAAVKNTFIGINFTTETYVGGGDSLTFITPNDASSNIDIPPGLCAFHAVGFGNNTFIILGEAGEILVSADGESWRTVTAPGSFNFSGIVWGKDKFVAVGDGGAMLTSPDGSSWTQQISGTDKKLYAVAYGNGGFVAVGGDSDNSVLLTSKDGVNWLANAHNHFCPIGAVAFGNNEFMMAAAGGWDLAMVSPDGKDWRKVRHPSSQLQALVYGNGQFVALDLGIEPVSSPDGNRWSSDFSQRRLGREWGGAYGNGIFVVVGAGVMTSNDGIHWTPQKLPPSRLLCGDFTGETIFMPSASFFHGRNEWSQQRIVGGMPRLNAIDDIHWQLLGREFYQNLPAITGNVIGNKTLLARFRHKMFGALTSEDGITWTRLQPVSTSQLKPPSPSVSSPSPDVSNIGVEFQLNGKTFNLNLTATVGEVFQLQASIDLEHWVNLATIMNRGEKLNFVDQDAARYPQRFYRLKLEP